jgi:phage tail sheath protein FI
MAFQVSPGVNVSEIDLTTVVPAVSTTKGGIAGHFRWGPVNKRVLITDESALFNNFRDPNSNTASDFFTAAAFLAYANDLEVVRVIDSTTTNETGRNSHGASANTLDTVIKNSDDYEDNYSSGIGGVGQWIAKFPGELGNSLKVSVCASANAWSSTLTGNLAVTTNTTAVTGFADNFANEVVVGDTLILGPDKQERRVSAVSANTITLETKYTGNTIVINVAHSNGVTRRWEYYNLFDATPGTSDYANTQAGNGDEMHVAVVDEDGQWTGRRNQVLERFEGVSLGSDAKTASGASNYYKNVLNNQSNFVWWAAHNSGNGNAGNKVAGTTYTGNTNPQTLSLVNGRDGSTPPNADYINGFNEFRDVEDVDISLLLGAEANQTIATHLIQNIAENRKDCIVCLSPRRADVVNNNGYDGSEVDDILAWRDLLPSSSYAVLDSGYKLIYDKYNDINRYVPLNGDVAGSIVRTDLVRDPWYSPAGHNRGQIKNVLKLPFNPSSKAARDLLYKKGVNPVVSFPGQGTVLFGDKTMLAKPSAFDRINVRRLFIILEKAIGEASKFTLFEFNDAWTRAQFKNMVEPFLRDIKGRRGIYDFKVVVDETNNTPAVIARSEFVGDIYIKPARAINYIQLNFVAVSTGVDFTTVVGSV